MSEPTAVAEALTPAAPDKAPDLIEQLTVYFTFDFAWLCLTFLVILLIAWIIGRVLAACAKRAIGRSKRKLGALLETFILTWIKRGILLIGLIIALETVGVATAPLIASLGVAGFILGFALQDTLGNFAAGLMLLFYRPFEIDDFIQCAGVSGIVTGLTVVSTTMRTPDNKVVIVPNSKVWGDVITNFTRNPTRRMDLVLSVSYSADLDQVQTLVRDFLASLEEPGPLAEPKPQVEVLSMGESSIDFAVRPWVNTNQYWDVYWRIQKGLKQLMDANDIEIPFPQRTVWMRQDA